MNEKKVTAGVTFLDGGRFQKRNLGISMEQRSPIKASHRALA